MPERHEGAGDKARLRRAWIFLRMGIGDLAEIVEGAKVVLRHAVAVGVHAAELPLRHRLPLLGGILKRGERFGFLSGLRRPAASAHRVSRRERSRARGTRAVEGESRLDEV